MSESQSRNLLLESFAAGPLKCNCTVLGDPGSRRGLIIDPGGDADRIMAIVEGWQLTIIAVVHTHAHLDHMLASAEIRRRTGAPLMVHRGDKRLWENFESECARFNLPCDKTPAPDRWLKDDDDLACVGGVAIHTPGHTLGSMSFWFEEHNLLVAGDTLFHQGIGRTDLPGGSFQQIENSIVDRLFTLADDAEVITGHGPATSLAFERRANPFFGEVIR